MSKHPDFIAYQIIKLSRFLSVDQCDLVLVQNATTATMSILQSLKLSSNEDILVTSLMYNAVARTLDHLKLSGKFTIQVLDIQVPTTHAEIVHKFERYLSSCEKKPRVCIFDHISSNTALILPVNEICALLRKHGIISIVDGAHAIGSVLIDLPNMKPDFYFSNCHKWLFAPIGAGMIM
jgi:selenocysteine lyase/cysteine desulfurase